MTKKNKAFAAFDDMTGDDAPNEAEVAENYDNAIKAAARKRPGRKKKHDTGSKRVTGPLMNPDEREMVSVAASMRGLSVADYIKNLIMADFKVNGANYKKAIRAAKNLV